MIWIIETIMLLIGLFIMINGWIIPFIGLTFLSLCLIAEVYAATKRVNEKTLKKDGTDTENVL